MAWREITKEDLTATLNEKEVERFGSDFSLDDAPLTQQLKNITATVRGYIRSGRKCRMSPNEAEVPEFLISPAMDYAAFNILKRLRLPVNESRSRAYDRAANLFEKVASGDIVPEDYDENVSDVEPAAQLARPAFTKRSRRLGRHLEEGI